MDSGRWHTAGYIVYLIGKYMIRKTKVIASCSLFVYCFLFLLANSPLHIYIFHRNGDPEVFDCSKNPFGSLTEHKEVQECPLCKFLSLTLFRSQAAIYVILMAFLYLLIISRYRILHLPMIQYYYSLAPPANII